MGFEEAIEAPIIAVILPGSPEACAVESISYPSTSVASAARYNKLTS